jgi:SAM-dependent methyltransferase
MFELMSDVLKQIDQNINFFHCKLLDVGCGNGNNIKGLLDKGVDAYGIDVEFKSGKYLEELIASSRIRKIGDESISRETKKFKDMNWPFGDGFFDLVISKAVVEHINDLDNFAYNSKKVSKKGSLHVHYFASKFALKEPHTGVIFGGVIKYRWYYRLHFLLKLMPKYFLENPDKAYNFVKDHTFYRTTSEIKSMFKKNGFVYQGDFGKIVLRSKLGIPIKILHYFPIIGLFFSIFRSKLLVFKNDA